MPILKHKNNLLNFSLMSYYHGLYGVDLPFLFYWQHIIIRVFCLGFILLLLCSFKTIQRTSFICLMIVLRCRNARRNRVGAASEGFWCCQQHFNCATNNRRFINWLLSFFLSLCSWNLLKIYFMTISKKFFSNESPRRLRKCVHYIFFRHLI
jgi:hypothetical protein